MRTKNEASWEIHFSPLTVQLVTKTSFVEDKGKAMIFCFLQSPIFSLDPDALQPEGETHTAAASSVLTQKGKTMDYAFLSAPKPTPM